MISSMRNVAYQKAGSMRPVFLRNGLFLLLRRESGGSVFASKMGWWTCFGRTAVRRYLCDVDSCADRRAWYAASHIEVLAGGAGPLGVGPYCAGDASPLINAAHA